MYTTLSNFDWEEFNRKTRKARDIIEVRPYSQRVMAGILALFVSFILYVALLSLGGLVTTLDLPVETGLHKLPEALKFIEVPILLLVIGNVLWSLNEEKEIIDIAELGRKEKRDVTSWTFWILEKLYMAEYAPVHENLDELLSKLETSQNHRTLFYKGLTLALEGKNKESEAYFKQSVAVNPKFADGWMELGVINYFEGHHQEALEFLHHAAKLKRSKTVFYNIGRVYDVLNDNEQALKAYQKAVKLDPTDYKVWANITAPLIHLGRIKEAVRDGQKALEYEPLDYVAMVNLSIALEKDGQLEASKVLQEKLQELHADNPQVLTSLASTRMQAEDIAGALELYDKLISLDGVTTANLSDVAFAFTKAGRPQDAIQVVQEFVQANPEDIRSRFLLGESYLGQNMVEQALTEFAFIAKREPIYETTLLKLGSCYGMLGRFPEALDVFMKAKDVLPDNADVWYNLALSKSMVGQTDFDDDFRKALQFARPFRAQFLTIWMQARAKINTLDQDWLDQIITELSPHTSLAELYATIGSGFQVLERFDDAVKYFQMSLEQEPNLQVKDALGLLYLNLQQFAQAERIFRELIANQPSIGAYNNLAVSLLRSGQVENGLTVLLEAHENHFPEDLTILGNIAYIYTQSKRYPEAIPYYEKMIVLNPDDYLTRNNLGKCLALADRVEEAQEQFKKALNQAQRAGDADATKQIQEFLQQLNG
jgi:tetratricopeptide (TPR) repeat protein